MAESMVLEPFARFTSDKYEVDEAKMEGEPLNQIGVPVALVFTLKFVVGVNGNALPELQAVLPTKPDVTFRQPSDKLGKCIAPFSVVLEFEYSPALNPITVPVAL